MWGVFGVWEDVRDVAVMGGTALCIIGKQSNTEQYPQLCFLLLILKLGVIL